MITRIARNDVVRLTRTGEVGTVKGWADHENLDLNGTIIDVEVARGKSIQANGNALEFVADAKPSMSGGKAVWVLLALLLSVAVAVMNGVNLHREYGVVWYGAAALGLGSFMLVWRSLYLLTIRPHKTRMRLPVRRAAK